MHPRKYDARKNLNWSTITINNAREAMTIRILLISPGGEVRAKYKEAIEAYGASVVAVSSFKRLDKNAANLRYHGIAVDLPTKIIALRKDKSFIYKVLGRFPIVQLNLNKQTGKISMSFDGRSHDGGLDDFINQKCSRSRPKKFRYHPRKEIHFNVQLAENNRVEDGDYERTITMDVSIVGCFVYSVRGRTPGEDVWIVLEELRDHTPIRAAVRHVIPWGESMSIPGAGLEFMDIKDDQLKELRKEFLDLESGT